MQTTAEKVMHIVPTLEQMLHEPFPPEQKPHDEEATFEHYERFLANTPDRLVLAIGYDYLEDEDDGGGTEEENFGESLALYDECLAMIEQAWGPGNKLSSQVYFEIMECKRNNKVPEDKQHPFYTTPDVLLDKDRIILGAYDYNMTWWPKGDRVALLHYTADCVDAGFPVMSAVSICVLSIQTT